MTSLNTSNDCTPISSKYDASDASGIRRCMSTIDDSSPANLQAVSQWNDHPNAEGAYKLQFSDLELMVSNDPRGGRSLSPFRLT